MKASDIMTTNIVSIDSSATIATAAKLMKQHHVRALIVERASEEDAYGIITATDLASDRQRKKSRSHLGLRSNDQALYRSQSRSISRTYCQIIR